MAVADRLTITPRVINAARKLLITVTGAAKAEALARALNGPYNPDKLPRTDCATYERPMYVARG